MSEKDEIIQELRSENSKTLKQTDYATPPRDKNLSLLKPPTPKNKELSELKLKLEAAQLSLEIEQEEHQKVK